MPEGAVADAAVVEDYPALEREVAKVGEFELLPGNRRGENHKQAAPKKNRNGWFHVGARW